MIWKENLKCVPSEVERNCVRFKIYTLIGNFLHHFSPTKHEIDLAKDINFTKRFLNTNNDKVQVLMSDKSDVSVILDKSEYNM